jgi:transposase
MQQLPDLSKLTVEEKDGLIWQLFEIVQALTARVQEMEGQLSKNSQNSSKPPSSDGLKKTNSQREPSGKKPGGQAGHAGKTLQQVENPDKVVQQKLPAQCDVCAAVLHSELAEIDQRRQVIDIPPVNYEVTEYQTLKLRCGCGKLHQSEFAPKVTEGVQYGPNIRAHAVNLLQGQLLPLERTCQLLRDLYDLAISPATLCAWVDEAAQRVAPSVEAIVQNIQNEAVVHADESGLRVDGKLQWLHTAVTASSTWYGVHSKRGMEAIEDLAMLPNCKGRLVHDCFAPYWQLDKKHALCGAHLLRELAYEQQLGGHAWAQEMTLVLRDTLQACDAARVNGVTVLPEAAIEVFTARYRAAVQAGQILNPPAAKIQGRRGRAKQSSAFNLLRRLKEYEDEVLCFMHDLAVPFTNNQAERAIRMPKVKQKISGSFRTFQGAQSFCTIRSYLDTAKKHGIGMLHALQAAFSSMPLFLPE